MLYPDPRLIQLDPAIYTRPHEFIPDRWLADRRPAGFPELSSSLFRSFEKGPRSCIGQEFAMATLRVMVVLLVRRFDFDLAYEELDRRLGRKPKLYEGVPRCYVSLINTGQPADGMPVFVKERPTQKSS
jgi:cytochrome P450